MTRQKKVMQESKHESHALTPEPDKKADQKEGVTERIYAGTQEMDCDTFKLQVATMKKNVSFTEIPMYEHFEHCHIFHTIDSNGRRQMTSNPVGGHFHEIEVIPQEGGGVPIIRVSPPRKWVQHRVNGRVRKKMVEIEHDQHTHEVLYLGSNRIRPRQVNAEYAKFEAGIKAKTEPVIPGVAAG